MEGYFISRRVCVYEGENKFLLGVILHAVASMEACQVLKREKRHRTGITMDGAP